MKFVLVLLAPLVAQLVLPSATVVVVVQAFPQQAGGCLAGAAVAGSHVVANNNGGSSSRYVMTGALSNNQIQVYVDGTELNTTIGTDAAKVLLGVEHTIEIVASNPFKGALIRVESVQRATFTLTPMIHAQVAQVCEFPVQGVTHTSSTMKHVLSATFRTEETADFVLDVTVVDYNNAAGSVYWYSQYTVKSVASLVAEKVPLFSEQSAPNPGSLVTDSVTIPISAKPSPSPVLVKSPIVSTHHSPSPSPVVVKSPIVPTHHPPSPSPVVNDAAAMMPTYDEKCIICGPGKRISTPDVKVVVMNESATCLELERGGAAGMIPPAMCAKVKTAARHSCRCVTMAVPATLQLTTTLAPSTTPFPTGSAFPTHSEKCYVCGRGGNVTKPNLMVTLAGVTGTCRSLLEDGAYGFIGSSLCGKATAMAKDRCGCTGGHTAPSPGTVAPTATRQPTTSAYPTYVKKCRVCREGMKVTALDTIVNVDGGVGTCQELEKEGLSGFIHPAMCADAQAMAKAKCGCDVAHPAPISVKTLQPTRTLLPTSTYSPSFGEKCSVCAPGDQTTKPAAIVVVGNIALTCSDLEHLGRSHLIPPQMCVEAQAQAHALCGCQAGLPRSAPSASLQPTVTTKRTMTSSPTFTEKCLICGNESRSVTHKNSTVTVAGMVVTCEELEMAGAMGMINPQICLESTKAALVACGCTALPVPKAAASVPTAAPHTNHSTIQPTISSQPTVTSMPSYSEKCAVCGNETLKVTNSTAVVTIGGMVWSCMSVQEFGSTGILPPENCSAVQEMVAISCACAPVSANQTNATAPFVAPPSAITPVAPPTTTTLAATTTSGRSTSSTGTILRRTLVGLTLLLSTRIF